jgi:hypothetical protein
MQIFGKFQRHLGNQILTMPSQNRKTTKEQGEGTPGYCKDKERIQGQEEEMSQGHEVAECRERMCACAKTMETLRLESQWGCRMTEINIDRKEINLPVIS